MSEQEDHYRRAYELAIEAQNKKSIADSLACLAELERSRGNLAKALSMCLEAEALAPDHAREAYHTHASICRTHGQFEEAVERLKQAGQVGAMLRPGAERHILSAIGCFERFLAETPHRINQPIGYYYLGECRRHQGDRPNALEEFKRATSVGIDCHHSRLAEQRLRELTD